MVSFPDRDHADRKSLYPGGRRSPQDTRRRWCAALNVMFDPTLRACEVVAQQGPLNRISECPKPGMVAFHAPWRGRLRSLRRDCKPATPHYLINQALRLPLPKVAPCLKYAFAIPITAMPSGFELRTGRLT